MRWVKYSLITLIALIVAYVVLASFAEPTLLRSYGDVTINAQQCYAGHSRYQAWRNKIEIPYRSSVPQSEWAAKVRKLQKGQSTKDVLQSFGEPDFVEAGVSKKGDRFLGCTWAYEVQLAEDSVNYKRNSWIEIFFDGANGKVVDFDSVNIDGIPNRPFPSPTR